MRLRKNKTASRIGITIIILTLGSLIFSFVWDAGYRFSLRPLAMTAPGTIHLAGIKKSDTVYVNENRRSPSRIDDTGAFFQIPAGIHTVTIGRKNKLPWAKQFTVREKTVGEGAPFFVNTIPVISVIAPTDDRYASYQAQLGTTSLPTESAPIRKSAGSIPGESVASYVMDTSIFAVWEGAESTIPRAFCANQCLPRIDVVDLKFPVTSLAFFPERSDVLIFSGDGTINAIEIDRRNIQNFQPIYKGTGSTTPFFVTPDGSLIADDNGTLIRIELLDYAS
jgi:hypothetical protein